MKYGIALSLLLAAKATEAFQPSSLIVDAKWGTTSLHRQRPLTLQQVAASTTYSNGQSSNATALYLASLVNDAVQVDDDVEEIELAERRRKVTERTGNYRVTLPLQETDDQPQSMGMTLRQFSVGGEVSDQVLSLDSLTMEKFIEEEPDDSVATISAEVMQGRLSKDFTGVYVSSIAVGSPGWNEGVRPGDLMVSTGATFGGALWPKTTLEGVRAALSSRKMVTESAAFEMKRTDVGRVADNVFELTLPKPIGLNLRETEDGFVEVVGFTPNAPNLVRQACRAGDRVIAVDSSLGDQMWPVSTVEGVISACTSRLPGQQVTLRFERPLANMNLEAEVIEKPAVVAQEVIPAVPTTEDQQVLLKRCRDILQRYAAEDKELSQSKPLAAGAKFVDKFAVPAMVADKVMEALARASAALDGVTLSMTMDAYLSCGKPDGAILAFETAVGLKGDGSTQSVSAIEGENSIQENPAALNLYTISCLLKAHAMNRDLRSVRLVVAAMEGRGGIKMGGLETAQWPGTGVGGLIVPDTQCYNIAISAAVKVGNSEGVMLALRLFDALQEPSAIFRPEERDSTKPEKNAVTYNSMISGLTTAGKYEDAFRIFFNMKRVGLKPDKFTYTSLLKACVHDGDLQELLYDMKEQGVEMDVVMYNARIRTLCDEGNLAEARTLITQMESKGVDPDSRTYGILMKGLLKSNKPGACLALFETACNNEQTRQITENIFLYTTAVTAASKLGDHDRALELVSRMTALGIKPNYKTLTALMGACLANQRPDLAAEVYKRIDSPDGYAMFQGLEAFCLSGDLTAAAGLLATQRRGNRTLSGKQIMQGYETIVTTAARYRDNDVARAMFTELLAKSYIPSKSMLRNIISAMGLVEKGRVVLEFVERDSEQFEFLLFMIDSMEERKLAVDSFLYAATIACGNQLGGKHREVALLMKQSKGAFDDAGGKVVTLEEGALSEPMSVQWEEILQEEETLKKLATNSALLPHFNVKVGKRDTKTVFFAEKFLSRPKPAVEEEVPVASQ